MAFGHCPFEDERQGVLTLAIAAGTVKFPTNREHRGATFSQGFCDLITSALAVDIHQRPSVSQLRDSCAVLRQQTVGGEVKGDDTQV